jgi:hypothetical protein
VVNATLSEDEVLHASRFAELCCVLSGLRDTYGQHPVLLETEADFTDEPSERVALYEQAKQAALAAGLLTYSIRVSLARVLMDDLGDRGRALQELLVCQIEVAACANDRERQEWQEMQRQCAHWVT